MPGWPGGPAMGRKAVGACGDLLCEDIFGSVVGERKVWVRDLFFLGDPNGEMHLGFR